MHNMLKNVNNNDVKPYHLAKECPITEFMSIFKGKWKPIIMCLLNKHSIMRFGELNASIKGISEKVLTAQLRELENVKVIKRTIYSQVPPKVEYSLTNRGCSVMIIFNQMIEYIETDS